MRHLTVQDAFQNIILDWDITVIVRANFPFGVVIEHWIRSVEFHSPWWSLNDSCDLILWI